MLKKHSQLFISLMFLADLAAIGGAWIVSYFVRFHTGWFSYVDEPRPLTLYLPLLPLVVGAFALSFILVKLYRPRRFQSFWSEGAPIVKSGVVGWFLFVAATYYYVQPDGELISRKLLFVFLVLAPLSLVVSHGMVRWVLRAVRRRGWNLRHVAIIGTGRVAQRTCDTIRHNAWTGMSVAYFVDDGTRKADPGTEIAGVPVRGPLEELPSIVQEHSVDAVFVAIPLELHAQLRHILDLLKDVPLDIRFVPDLLSLQTMNATASDFDGLPVVSLRESPIFGWSAIGKRVFDIVVSVLGLAVMALPMLVIALLIKLTSKGPVFYRQTRMGLNTKPFSMLKFRSMRVGSEADTGAVWAAEDDPRRTRFGTFLRRTSLDELPQLFNVLTGDMSLVGPRPERPEFMEGFQQEIPTFILRHKVKAGMTGWAQVNGLRGNTSLEKRIQYDLYYVNNWSIGFDLRILLLTFREVIAGKNAY